MITIEDRYLANDLFASSELCLKLLRACHKHSCVDGQLRAQLQEDLGSEVIQCGWRSLQNSWTESIQINANCEIWWDSMWLGESVSHKSFARWGEWSAWSVWHQNVDFVDVDLSYRTWGSPTFAFLFRSRNHIWLNLCRTEACSATCQGGERWHHRHPAVEADLDTWDKTFWTWNLFRLV